MPFQVLSATLPQSESLKSVKFCDHYGGHVYELNGTAQTTLAQLKELYPEIELPKRSTVNVESRALLKKNKVSPSIIPTRCGTLRGIILSGIPN